MTRRREGGRRARADAPQEQFSRRPTRGSRGWVAPWRPRSSSPRTRRPPGGSRGLLPGIPIHRPRSVPFPTRFLPFQRRRQGRCAGAPPLHPLLPVTTQHLPHRASAAVLPASMGSCCGDLLDHLPELQPPSMSATYCCRSPLTRVLSPDHSIPPSPAQPPPPPGFDAPSTRNAGVIDRCSWPSAAARAGRAHGRPPRRGGHAPPWRIHPRKIHAACAAPQKTRLTRGSFAEYRVIIAVRCGISAGSCGASRLHPEAQRPPTASAAPPRCGMRRILPAGRRLTGAVVVGA
jgi:hypothetical protein